MTQRLGKVPAHQMVTGLNAYKEHDKFYNENFRKKNKLPKNYDWRPYRWCSRNIVFSLVAVKHNRKGNYLDVDVCLMANPPQYIKNSGARTALGFLLSEAYKCSGTMEIVFSKKVEDGRVPIYVCDLADELSVKLKFIKEGHITPYESRQLYLRLIGFSKEAQEKILQMAVNKLVLPERVCFLVMSGIWSLPEIESIILGSQHPERILLSTSSPNDRHLYLGDLIVSNMAIFGGILDGKLLRIELMEDGQIIESEDVQAPLSIGFDANYFAKIYSSEADFLIPWIVEDKMLTSGQQMVVLIRARSDGEIQKYFPKDLENLKDLVFKYKKDPETMIFYLLPRDFEDVDLMVQSQIVEQLKKEGVYLMVSPDTLASLGKESILRLETGRRTRQ